MAKKNYTDAVAKATADMLGYADTYEPSKATTANDYRFNARFPMEMKDYLSEMAWINRVSITEYLISLVRKDMEEHPNWQDTLDALNDVLSR